MYYYKNKETGRPFESSKKIEGLRGYTKEEYKQACIDWNKVHTPIEEPIEYPTLEEQVRTIINKMVSEGLVLKEVIKMIEEGIIKEGENYEK